MQQAEQGQEQRQEERLARIAAMPEGDANGNSGAAAQARPNRPGGDADGLASRLTVNGVVTGPKLSSCFAMTSPSTMCRSFAVPGLIDTTAIGWFTVRSDIAPVFLSTKERAL